MTKGSPCQVWSGRFCTTKNAKTLTLLRWWMSPLHYYCVHLLLQQQLILHVMLNDITLKSNKESVMVFFMHSENNNQTRQTTFNKKRAGIVTGREIEEFKLVNLSHKTVCRLRTWQMRFGLQEGRYSSFLVLQSILHALHPSALSHFGVDVSCAYMSNCHEPSVSVPACHEAR